MIEIHYFKYNGKLEIKDFNNPSEFAYVNPNAVSSLRLIDDPKMIRKYGHLKMTNGDSFYLTLNRYEEYKRKL